MPRNVTEFRVVVASPSDMFEMRKAVFYAVEELNRTFEIRGVSVRALGWEEYVTPGIGTGAQDVINKQILEDYDVLIALFGTKLGTPTENAPSGTVEEIENAIAKGGSALGMHRVQVYFRDKIDSVSNILAEDLTKLIAYRDTLKSRGVLYKLFNDRDDLQQEARVNLQRPILDYLVGLDAANARNSSRSQSAEPDQDAPKGLAPEEVGLLDLQESAEEAIAAFNTSIESMTNLIQEIGNETNNQVSLLESAAYAEASTRQKKSKINQFAEFIETRASQMEKGAKSARQQFNFFSDAFVSLSKLEDRSSPDYEEGIAAFLSAAETTLSIITESRASTASYKATLENIPKITIQFNKAKRSLIDALSESLAMFDHVEKKLFEISASI